MCGSHPREVSSALLMLLTCFKCIRIARNALRVCTHPQGGKLGVTNVTDVFSSVFESLTMPCVRARMSGTFVYTR